MQLLSLKSSNPTINTISLILACISILGMIATLLWFCVYKKILEYTYKNSKALETIEYTPVLKWITNINFISIREKSNPFISNSFEIMLRNYYEMYSERFTTLCKQTTLFLDSNSNRSWPLFSNLIRAKELNKRIEILRLDVRETVANVQDIIELQTIVRNWFIEINDKSNLILEIIKEKNQKITSNSVEIWRVKSLNENKLYKLNENLNEVKENIKNAKYLNAFDNLKNISSFLGETTQFIDSTDKINNLINVELRERLSDIAKEIESVNLSIKEKTKNLNAFISLQNSYITFVKSTKIEIYSLKIEDAYKRCFTMIDQIKKHESNLKYEMLIKNFIKSNHSNLIHILNQCNSDIFKTLETIEFNNKFGVKTTIEKQKLDDIHKSFNNLRSKAISVFNQQNDSKLQEYTINHMKKGQEIKDIFEKSRVILNQLVAIRSSLKLVEDFKIELESKIISYKKMLLATELIIAKNPKIDDLKRFIPPIQNGFDRLIVFENVLKNDPDLMKSQKSIEEFSEYLDDSNSEIAKLKTEMAQCVYIAKMAEMSLAYSARFSGIESFDLEIEKSLNEFENGQYKECLNRNITFLKEMKINNKSAVS